MTTLIAVWQAYGQSNYMATNTVVFPRLVGGGGRIPAGGGVTNFYPNSYPFNRIAGDGQDDEYMNYVFDKIGHRQSIPEIMPTEQDTNGNWGALTDGMQISVRFRQPRFVQGKTVPAYIILRNLDSSPRKWWRNALPDNGYQFTLQRGTNIFNWMRPQQKHVSPMYVIGSMDEGDPYSYVAEPKTEGLTIVYLNRFFDLSQPGEYSLQVQIQVPTADGKGTTNVVSGTAKFEVVKELLH